jgi:hypothetical protein
LALPSFVDSHGIVTQWTITNGDKTEVKTGQTKALPGPPSAARPRKDPLVSYDGAYAIDKET